MIYIELSEGVITKQNNMPFDDKFGEGLSKEQLELKGYLVAEIPPLKKGYKYSVESDGLETKLILVKDDSKELEIEERLMIAEETLKELCVFYDVELNIAKENKEILERLTLIEKTLFDLMMNIGGSECIDF